jgi:hypothetical protein
MNPFQTSNSSSSNLDQIVSLLNSIVTDLKLTNGPPETTEIPDRSTSSESGYISEKEEKKKSEAKVSAKSGILAEESIVDLRKTPELKAIAEPLSKVLDQLEPLVTQTIEPQAKDAPLKDGQSVILVIAIFIFMHFVVFRYQPFYQCTTFLLIKWC